MAGRGPSYPSSRTGSGRGRLRALQRPLALHRRRNHSVQGSRASSPPWCQRTDCAGGMCSRSPSCELRWKIQLSIPTTSFVWDQARGHYSIYARGWKRHGIRDIRRFTSRDCPNLVRAPLSGLRRCPDCASVQECGHPLLPAADIILMFPKRFLPERRYADHWKQDGLSDIDFMFSC